MFGHHPTSTYQSSRPLTPQIKDLLQPINIKGSCVLRCSHRYILCDTQIDTICFTPLPLHLPSLMLFCLSCLKIFAIRAWTINCSAQYAVYQILLTWNWKKGFIYARQRAHRTGPSSPKSTTCNATIWYIGSWLHSVKFVQIRKAPTADQNGGWYMLKSEKSICTYLDRVLFYIRQCKGLCKQKQRHSHLHKVNHPQSPLTPKGTNSTPKLSSCTVYE